MLLDLAPALRAHPRAEPQYWWRQAPRPVQPVRTASELPLNVEVSSAGVLVDVTALGIDPTGDGAAVGALRLTGRPSAVGVTSGTATARIGVLHRGARRHTDISRRIVEKDDATVLAIIASGV